MKYQIIPSIIARSQKELEERIDKVKRYANLIQLDVMDGELVPHTSFEFNFKLPKNNYEAHLMLESPKGWLMKHKSSINSVIIHYESEAHIHEFIKLAKKHKKKVGIALNPDTDAEAIKQYLKYIDKILVMTVYPGKYGSRFQSSELNKINFLRGLAPRLDIEVDGGIDNRTIKLCKQAGANQFVVGSYLQNARNVKSAMKELKAAIK